MTNWWEELELETETEKRLQAEVERLRAVNARLVAVCEKILNVGWLSKSAVEEIEQAIADAEGQSSTQPTGPKLPGLE